MGDVFSEVSLCAYIYIYIYIIFLFFYFFYFIYLVFFIIPRLMLQQSLLTVVVSV